MKKIVSLIVLTALLGLPALAKKTGKKADKPKMTRAEKVADLAKRKETFLKQIVQKEKNLNARLAKLKAQKEQNAKTKAQIEKISKKLKNLPERKKAKLTYFDQRTKALTTKKKKAAK